MDAIVRQQIISKAGTVFFRPVTYPYDGVIRGVSVSNKDRTKQKQMMAVDKNTYKSWHKKYTHVANGKKDKSGFKGPKQILFDFFGSQETRTKGSIPKKW